MEHSIRRNSRGLVPTGRGLVPRGTCTSISRRGSVSNRARVCMCEGVESSVSRAGNGRSEVSAPPTLARRKEGRRRDLCGTAEKRDRGGVGGPRTSGSLATPLRGRGWRGILPRATYIHTLYYTMHIRT